MSISLQRAYHLNVHFVYQCSDEDEELYERLCGEQWRVECVAQLLGEMKDSDLPANFFLQLLQVWPPTGQGQTHTSVTTK